jgi:hypothetical protein
MSDSTAVQRTKAALEQTQGKTVKAVNFESEGIVFHFVDESVLEVDIGVEQSKPILMAHFQTKRKGSAA